MKSVTLPKSAVVRQPGLSGGLTSNETDTTRFGMPVDRSASDAPLARSLSRRRFAGTLSITG